MNPQFFTPPNNQGSLKVPSGCLGQDDVSDQQETPRNLRAACLKGKLELIQVFKFQTLKNSNQEVLPFGLIKLPLLLFLSSQFFKAILVSL